MIASILELDEETKGPKNYWAVIFATHDINATLREVVAAGGSVLMEPTAGFESTMSTDDQGAMFCIAEPNAEKQGNRSIRVAQHDDTTGSRPKMSDFDPCGGCLDAQNAWRHFGGLSIPEAYTRFCEAPESYQEDFMFMGTDAFLYYFPVIERYILESRVDDDENQEVEAMWILAHCIGQQFEDREVQRNDSLRLSIRQLIDHVRNNLSQYCSERVDQQHVDMAWEELQSKIFHSQSAE